MNYLFRKTSLASFIFLAVMAACTSDRSPEKGRQGSISTPPPISNRPKIIAYGDSLIAGYGIEGWENSFSARLQKLVSAGGYNYQVLNLGVNGDTVQNGYSRLHLTEALKDQRIFILELGANNISRKDDPHHIREYLRDIIAELSRIRKVDILLCGYRSPPAHGEEYGKAIDELYSSIASEYGLHFMPDFMAGVSDDPELMQPDGIHPNPKGAQKIAENVFTLLKPLLAKNERSKP